ncbi:MAG: hypothetical protein JKY15_08835 [Deltaproteobacteria bacterium]|nr:hypothetical protein [Deltaproteobacteria bacterium]
MRVLSFLLLSIILSGTTFGAGITVHVWFAEEAVRRTTGELHDLLVENIDYVRNGAIFPDSGYSVHYSEECHWPGFMNKYFDYIKGGCFEGGKLHLEGECGGMIAHFFGAISHGIADLNYDSKFLGKLVELGYYSDIDPAQSGDECLDVMALTDPNLNIIFNVPAREAMPNLKHLVNVLNSIPLMRGPITETEVACGVGDVWWGLMLERIYAQINRNKCAATAPQWALEHRFDGPGGIDDTANVILGIWQEAWIQLTEKPAGSYVPKELKLNGGWPHGTIYWDNK